MIAMRTQIGGGPAFFRLVRYWSRRWQHTAGDERRIEPQLLHVQLLEAIDAAAARGAVSVSQVADELGLDRSGASRMISVAVSAGHVERRSAEDDARRAEVAMTRRGRALLGAARTWQQAAFERMLADWSRADVQRFSSYLERLAQQTWPEGSQQ